MNSLIPISSSCFRATGDYKIFTAEMRCQLIEAARRAPVRRARINFHPADGSPVQEMIIAMCSNTEISIHQHTGKSESFNVLEGRVVIGLYDSDGRLFDMVDLNGGNGPRYYRLDCAIPHLVSPLSDIVIIHETTVGPFDLQRHHEQPTWSCSVNISAYRSELQRLVDRKDEIANR